MRIIPSSKDHIFPLLHCHRKLNVCVFDTTVEYITVQGDKCGRTVLKINFNIISIQFIIPPHLRRIAYSKVLFSSSCLRSFNALERCNSGKSFMRLIK